MYSISIIWWTHFSPILCQKHKNSEKKIEMKLFFFTKAGQKSGNQYSCQIIELWTEFLTYQFCQLTSTDESVFFIISWAASLTVGGLGFCTGQRLLQRSQSARQNGVKKFLKLYFYFYSQVFAFAFSQDFNREVSYFFFW